MKETSKFGLAVSETKSKYLQTTKRNDQEEICLGYDRFEVFRYLGTVFTNRNEVSVD